MAAATIPHHDMNRLHPSGLSPSHLTSTAPLLGQPSPISPLMNSFGEPASASQGYFGDVMDNTANVPGVSPLEAAPEAGTSRSRTSSRVSLSRGNTLKKKKSLSRKSSLNRSSSKKSIRDESAVAIQPETGGNTSSVFHTPIPTSASPTEALANRFQSKFRNHFSLGKQLAL
jgi:hypothetical protein